MTFIRLVPGSVITLNLLKLERFTKDLSGEISEVWENDLHLGSDDDEAPLHLLVRIHLTDGKPWITAHNGSLQVLNAPIAFTAERLEGRSVYIQLMDFSNRRNRTAGGLQENSQCIRRWFKFTFLSGVEAWAFRLNHNMFLKTKTEPSAYENGQICLDVGPCPSNHHDDVLHVDDEVKVKKEETVAPKCVVDLTEEEDSKTNVNVQRVLFNDESNMYTLEDDCFENTQGYDVDDY